MMKLDIMRNTGQRWELIDGKPTRIEEKKEIKIETPVIIQSSEMITPVIIQSSEMIKTFEQELNEIKGIGKETISDIKRIYKTKEELIIALKENKVPLRNDIVEKLKQRYL